LQSALLITRIPASDYALTSAKAFLADRRMDSLDPATALTRWKATGWSRNESYIRFLLDFGEAIDGKSGREIIAIARQEVANTRAANHAQAIKKLEQRRLKAIAQLQQVENRKGACGNRSQLIARKDIERMDTTLAAMKANQPFEPFRSTPNSGLIRETCSGHPKLKRYGAPPVTPDIAAGRQRSDARSTAKEVAYQKGLGLLAVTQVRSLEFASRSRYQAQLEAWVDVRFLGTMVKTPTRIAFQLILTPKAGGKAIYFAGRFQASGQSGNAGENLQTFATILRPEGVSDQLGDYRVSAVVTDLKYQDGSRERLVASLRDFKTWLAARTQQAP